MGCIKFLKQVLVTFCTLQFDILVSSAGNRVRLDFFLTSWEHVQSIRRNNTFLYSSPLSALYSLCWNTPWPSGFLCPPLQHRGNGCVQCQAAQVFCTKISDLYNFHSRRFRALSSREYLTSNCFWEAIVITLSLPLAIILNQKP